MVEIVFRDEKGQLRTWEGVHRKHRAEAVAVAAQMKPSGRYVLIRQFRPPAGKYMLEFPAGLIDGGESPEQTARRELKEEPGYHGLVESVTPPLYSSPGLLSETCYLAHVSIDENQAENLSPLPENESGEYIEVILKDPGQILEYLGSEEATGIGIDIKLYSYFIREGFKS